MSQRPIGHRPTLRPRAGLAATALLIAGLAGSGAVAFLGAGLVEPARARSASPTDPSTPPTTSAPGRADGHVPAAN